MSLEVVIANAEGETRRQPLKGGRLSLGRARDNDLCYPGDGSLSRHHLAFENNGDGWMVQDLGSKNGSTLNGRLLSEPRPVQRGDRLTVGGLKLRIADSEDSLEEEVVFAPDAGLEIRPDATVVTSLEGVLATGGEPTRSQVETVLTPRTSRGRQFASPMLQAMLRAGRELTEHRPLDELFPRILDLSIDAAGADHGVLMSLEHGKLVTQAVHGEGFRISTMVRDRVLQEKRSILVRNVEHDEAFRRQDSLSEQRVQTMMAVPLQTKDDVIGLIYVDSRSLGREFDTDDLNLLTVLANIAATQIEHQRLLELEQREQRRTIDLEQAAEIQRGILPGVAPELPGVELHGHNAPCRTVGGDYYDFLSYPDGRIAVVLGDVAGKGMAAALLMSNLQAMVRILFEEPCELSSLMRRLDQGVARNFPDNRFLSLFIGVLDRSRERLVYCNAGHNPPLLVRRDGAVEWMRASDPVLGVLPDASYREQVLDLQPGDLLALYSDGVTESTDVTATEFGEQRLAERVVQLRDRPARDVVGGVVLSLNEWSGSAPPTDDLTLVVVRLTP